MKQKGYQDRLKTGYPGYPGSWAKITHLHQQLSVLLHLPRILQHLRPQDGEGLGEIGGAVGRWLTSIVVGQGQLRRVGRCGYRGGRVSTCDLWGQCSGHPRDRPHHTLASPTHHRIIGVEVSNLQYKRKY